MTDFIDLRVFYRKTGRLKYISHLDVNRCIQRAFKRAGLPIWHTQGFNPHPYLTFALPLSLGYESYYECMDFRLTEPVEPQEVVQRLNAALPDGLDIFAAGTPQQKVSAIASADYELRLYADDPAGLAEAWDNFLSNPWIEVEKKTKKGIKKVDLKPELLRCEREPQMECLVVRLSLPAGERMFSPSLLIGAFEKEYPDRLSHVSVIRTAIRCGDGSLFS